MATPANSYAIPPKMLLVAKARLCSLATNIPQVSKEKRKKASSLPTHSLFIILSVE